MHEIGQAEDKVMHVDTYLDKCKKINVVFTAVDWIAILVHGRG